MIRGVIFDLDNTLVDFMKMKELCIHAAVDAMLDAGLNAKRDIAINELYAIYDKEGIEYQQIFDRFLENVQENIRYRIQAAGIHAYRRQRSASLVPYPHVKETLVWMIKKGLRIGVISDAPRQQAWLRLVAMELHYFFDHVVTFDDTGVKKPDPEPFLLCLKNLQLSADEALMVGDWADRDLCGARSIGMKTVFAKYGDIFKTTNSGADFEITDFDMLKKIILELTSITGK